MRQYDFDDEPFVVIEKHEGGVGSFLAGLAIGAGIALLFAPQSGEETRRSLGRRASRVRQAAQDAVEEVTDTVADRFQQARAQVEERIESARQAIEMKKEQVHRAMEAGRDAARVARDDLERRIAETRAAYEAGADVARASRGGRRARAVAADDDIGV